MGGNGLEGSGLVQLHQNIHYGPAGKLYEAQSTDLASQPLYAKVLLFTEAKQLQKEIKLAKKRHSFLSDTLIKLKYIDEKESGMVCGENCMLVLGYERWQQTVRELAQAEYRVGKPGLNEPAVRKIIQVFAESWKVMHPLNIVPHLVNQQTIVVTQGGDFKIMDSSILAQNQERGASWHNLMAQLGDTLFTLICFDKKNRQLQPSEKARIIKQSAQLSQGLKATVAKMLSQRTEPKPSLSELQQHFTSNKAKLSLTSQALQLNEEGTFGRVKRGGQLIYQGKFKNGMFEGLGQLFSLDNEQDCGLEIEGRDLRWLRYQGEFKEGMRQGFGKVHFKNGGVFRGEFKRDRANGVGVLIDQNSEIAGNWVDGRLPAEVIITREL